MSKVLKVTKSDKTVHVVPLANKSFYLHLNNRVLAEGAKMKLEEIDEKDAEKLEYFDETYVSGTEAQGKVADYQKEIAALKAQLAAKNEAAGNQDSEGDGDNDEDDDDSEDDADENDGKPKTPKISRARASNRKKA